MEPGSRLGGGRDRASYPRDPPRAPAWTFGGSLRPGRNLSSSRTSADRGRRAGAPRQPRWHALRHPGGRRLLFVLPRQESGGRRRRRRRGRVRPGGTNARLESIQAAILRAKLPFLENWTQERERIAQRYLEGLAGLPLILPAPAGPDDRHVWHVFAVRHPRRDWLRAELAARGIETGIHYPKPVHLQPACRYMGYQDGDFPLAEAFCRETLSLPLWTGMPVETQERVMGALRELLGG